jgi:two-component sensor histidine kinase
MRLAPRPEAAHAARTRLRELPMPPETLDTVTLLLTELVTNAMRHADVPEGSEIEVEVRRKGSVVRVDVRNEGDSFGWRRRAPRPTQPGGLGLLLVDRLATRWGFSGGSGTRFWLEVGA